MMAFVTVEDMEGSVEVILFPKVFEQYRSLLQEDAKIFVRGRASVSDEEQGRVICEEILPFDSLPKELWIQFADKDSYTAREKELLMLLAPWEGTDPVHVFLKKEKAYKKLPMGYWVQVTPQLLEQLYTRFGQGNIKVVEKTIENRQKMH